MQTDREFGPLARKLEQLMGRELGLTSGSLVTRATRARRRLPKHIKEDLRNVAEAEHLSQHPRIAPQIDRKKVGKSYKRALFHLRGPGPSEQRKTRIIGAGAALAFNLILVFALVIGAMYLSAGA